MKSGEVLRYRVCDSELTVAIEDPAVMASVEALFHPYGTGRSRGGTGEPPAVAIRFVDGERVVEWDGASRERCRTLSQLVIATEYALTHRFLAACNRLAHVHAAGAVARDRAVVCLGGSGAGKSSIALCWSLGGVPLLGDDVLMVDRDARVLPFKRLLKVVPTLLEERGIDLSTTPCWTPGSEEAWFDPTSAGGWGEPVSVGVVALVRYRRGAALEVNPVEGPAMLTALLHSLMPSGLGRTTSFERLLTICRGARTLTVTYGSAAQAATSLIESVA